MNRFEAFKNLMVLAAADGRITEEEIAMLAEQSEQWEITEEQFAAAIQFAQQGDSGVVLPDTKDECREMLSDWIRMMAADGDLADAEKQLFAYAAAKMKFSGEELNEMLDELLGTNDP